jgi:hypothetical protein
MSVCPCCFKEGLTLIKIKYTENVCCENCELIIRKMLIIRQMLYVGTNNKQKMLTEEEIKTLPKEK